jgi:hypothetical protein
MAKRRSIVLAIGVGFVLAIAAPACSSTESDRDVTFANTIGPLVQQKCQNCHCTGGIAPFSLATYDEVKAMGERAKEKVARREMPPWGAFDDDSCSVIRKYKDDLSLTQKQIDTFVQWVDRGMPRGSVRAAPTPTVRPTGIVDKTGAYDVATSHMVDANAADDMRCFPVDPGFTRDTWILESMVVPVDPKVVHHALVYIDKDHEGVAKAGAAGSYPCFGGPELTNAPLLLAWSPGEASTTYGENAGVWVPKGAHLVTQVHYHPIDTSTTGRMSIEVKGIPASPGRVAQFVLLGNAADGAKGSNPRLLPGTDDPPEGPAFVIPPNAKQHVEAMEFLLPDTLPPTSIAAAGAHMHWAGVGMKIELIRKAPVDEEPANECLLSMPKYDFTWQRTFAYDTPSDKYPIVRRGDKLRITCTYDNTPDNPHISQLMNEQRMASPPTIRLGGRSVDEMCQAMLVVIN